MSDQSSARKNHANIWSPQDQPPSAAFEKIMQAIGMYDHWIDSQHATPVESDQWGQHAVQAYVWRLIGERCLCIEI